MIKMIKVFISSKCGGERINFDQLVDNSGITKKDLAKRAVITNYDLIRKALKLSLEKTGLIEVYLFEDEASTLTAKEDYLTELDRSDVCLFLIDNFDDTTPEGLLEEITYAQSHNKKSFYLFLNHPGREKTSFQKSLTGPDSYHYKELKSLKEFIDDGFQVIINDILKIYQMYCGGHLNFFTDNVSTVQVSKDVFPGSMADIDKQIFSNLGLIRNKIANLVFGDGKNAGPSSDLDQLCLSILEMLLGERDFIDISIPSLLEMLAKIQPSRLNELIAARWHANSSFFSGDLDSAITATKSAYEKYQDDAMIPKWLLNDVLIDWRNLEDMMGQRDNLIIFSVQEKINQLEALIFFPLIDRFRTNISDDILERKFKDLTNSPYTTSFYNLDYLFGYVSNYLLTAIYYGSRTHLHLALKEIQRILLDLVQTENNLRFKIQLMRIGILLGDEDMCTRIIGKYKSSLSHSSTKDILDLYNLADRKFLPHQKVYWKVILFMEFGYYFSDIDYQIISTEILNISRTSVSEETLNISLIDKIIKALKSNKDRLPEEEIIGFGLEIFNHKYYRFLNAAIDLLVQLDFSTIAPDLISQLLSQINDTTSNLEIKNRISNVDHLFIRLRKCRVDFGSEIDKMVENNYPDFFKNEYHLETVPGERGIHIQRFIESIRARNKVQGKSGTFIMFADNPYITIMNIIRTDNIVPSKKEFEDLLQEIAVTLVLDTQTYSAKISSIQLLLFLKQQDFPYTFDWTSYYSDLQQNITKIRNAQTDFIEQESTLSLQLYVAILQAVFGENPLQDMLEVLALITSGSDHEKINSLIALYDFLLITKQINLRGSSLIPIIFQYTSAFCFHNDDELRYRTIPVLYELIDSEFSDFVIGRLAKMMDDNDFQVKWAILDQALLIKSRSESTFNYVISKARIDNNYLIRKIVDKYADEIKIGEA